VPGTVPGTVAMRRRHGCPALYCRVPAETLDASRASGRAGGGPPRPGLIGVFSGRAILSPLVLSGAEPLVLGRGAHGFDDARMSRRHAEVRWAEGRFHVRDLGSRNGTLVDGVAAAEGAVSPDARILRVGDTLLVLRRDARPFVGAVVRLDDDAIVGPLLQAAHDEIGDIARTGDVLCLQGETGAGKEVAARAFHAAGPQPAGPFVAVNCASVPAALAERLLFGARKGAYSGADSDVQGFVQAADGGTLFLDEIVELSAEVQAKLLRVIETRQVTPLGATQPRPVRLRLVCAGHADLKAAVAAGRFREDLYYRVARPLVTVPPLRDRLEDIPWLVQSVLARADRALAAHVSLVEEAMLRPWPGNVRELRSEVGEAARRAAQAGEDRVRSVHLDGGAGRPLAAPAGPARDPLDRAGVEGALRAARGNVSEAARRLGLHRNQLRRWLADNGVDASRMR